MARTVRPDTDVQRAVPRSVFLQERSFTHLPVAHNLVMVRKVDAREVATVEAITEDLHIMFTGLA